MENNVVIPQYLFDELIEYFDNKSDADNGTPNKEMKLLSQLQEEHSLRESKGCVWVKADERLPDKSKLDEWFSLKLQGFPAIGTFIKFIDSDELGFDIEKYGDTHGSLNIVEWLDESNSTDEFGALSNFKKIIKETPEHTRLRVKLEMDLLDAKAQNDELIKEVERLKSLIKDAYDVGYDASSYAHDNSLEAYIKEPQSWEEFKTENKL